MPAGWAKLQQQVGEIESEALDACRPDVSLNEIYRTLEAAYLARGHAAAILEHHQGSTTGYLAREIVATPETLSYATPIAWSPSLRGGAKTEDTLPPETELIVIDSGVPRSLANSEYNQRRSECEQAAAYLGCPRSGCR